MRKDLMTLSDFSKATGINSRKLRYLDMKGKLCPAEKTDKGFRYYDKGQITEALRIVNKPIVLIYSKETIDIKQFEAIKIREKKYKVINILEENDIKTVDKVISDTIKGQVRKIYVMNDNNLIQRDKDEYKKWFNYLSVEMVFIEGGNTYDIKEI